MARNIKICPPITGPLLTRKDDPNEPRAVRESTRIKRVGPSVKDPIIVIGLGTGRSGTTSLAGMLNAQKKAYVTHEYFGPVPIENWDIRALIGEMLTRAWMGYEIVGDVALQWIYYIHEIKEKMPNVKIVAMKRPREEMIESFMRHTAKRNSNHWQLHPEESENIGAWSKSFPKYDEPTKRDALGAYWDDYNKRVFEANLKPWPTISLGQSNLVEEILSTIGVKDPVILTPRLNQSRNQPT